MNNLNYSIYPPSSPFDEGMLRVGEHHSIHYALYGNPAGDPVFFLHGGPGCGCFPDDTQWFNPEKYLIVLHDQRGSGKSRPLAEIKENTPRHLVDDIRKLKEHLNINETFSIFAGSWGTTLALLYAEQYPEDVKRMILRGIFTCGYDEQDWFYTADGAARFSPQAWEELISVLPKGPGRVQDKIFRLIEDSDMAGKEKWCRVLAKYEYSFFGMSEEEFDKVMSDFNSYYPEMRINIFYQANRFFLQDNQILKNCGRIKDIPVTIIHGERDLVCPPALAWNLHKHLPESELILVKNAGHLSSEPGIKEELLKSLSRWE